MCSRPLLTGKRTARSSQVGKCLSVKGAEDAINKACAFEVCSTTSQTSPHQRLPVLRP